MRKRRRRKTIEMRRRRRRRRKENNRILWPKNLFKCATFYLFLSLHFAPEELT